MLNLVKTEPVSWHKLKHIIIQFWRIFKKPSNQRAKGQMLIPFCFISYRNVNFEWLQWLSYILFKYLHSICKIQEMSLLFLSITLFWDKYQKTVASNSRFEQQYNPFVSHLSYQEKPKPCFYKYRQTSEIISFHSSSF